MDALDQALTPYIGSDTTRLVGRLGLALILGLIIGLDREARQKPAGLRSHMLVSLAAASFTIMTFAIVDAASDIGDAVRADPVRLMEAVVTGIAFLGAGTIIQSRGTVRGITTGASLWLAGALGVACGIGYFKLAIITTVLGLVVLFVIGWLASRFGPRDED